MNGIKNFSRKVLIALLLFIPFFFVIIFDLPKKIISRGILSHELSILPNLIVKKLNKKTDIDLYSVENKYYASLIFNNYVAKTTMPVKENLDDGASWKLLHGSIWCDGVSDIFGRMNEVLNIRSYIVFLYNDKEIAPHALAYVDFENKKINRDKNNKILDFERLYLFDPQNNYLPLNAKGELVRIKYFIENEGLYKNLTKLDSDGKKLNLLKNRRSEFFSANMIDEDNSFIRSFSKKIVKLVPDIFFEKLILLSIKINPSMSNDHKQYFYARINHVLLNYKQASKEYLKIKKESEYFDYAKFWIDQISKSNVLLNDIKISEIKNNFINKKI